MKITAVDRKDVLGIFRFITYLNAIEMNSVDDLVDGVVKKSAGNKVSHLSILDHGNPLGIEIGKDWLDTSSINFLHKSALQRLSTQFTPNAVVQLFHCNVGRNLDFLQALANILKCEIVATPNYTNPFLGVNYAGYTPTKKFTGNSLGTLPDPLKSYQNYVSVLPSNR